jgi:FHA domain
MANWLDRLQRLAGETRRRSVFKVATVYAVTAYGASMGVAQILPAFDAPAWAVRGFMVLAALGLPIAIALAWAYEFTDQGIFRDRADNAGDDPVHPGRPASRTTILFGSHGLVRVSWRDGATQHERTFGSSFKLGRDATCALHFDDPMVSRQHAQVTFEDGRWWISDLGSRNGTTVSGKQVRRVPLPARCEVRLYEAGPTLAFELKPGSAAATVTPPIMEQT